MIKRKELSSYFETEMTEYDLGVHAGWRKSFELILGNVKIYRK